MKFTSKCLLVFALVFTNGLSSFAEDDFIDQGDAAIMLLHRLGLGKGLPPNPTKIQAIREFERHGIFPFGNWESDKQLFEGDFAKILVESLRWKQLIPEADRNSAQAYVDLLAANGITIRSFSETIGAVRASDYPKGGDLVDQEVTTDPLRRRTVVAEPDEKGFGLDLANGLVARPGNQAGQAVAQAAAPVAAAGSAGNSGSGSGGAALAAAPAANAVTVVTQAVESAPVAAEEARRVVTTITRTQTIIRRVVVTPN